MCLIKNRLFCDKLSLNSHPVGRDEHQGSCRPGCCRRWCETHTQACPVCMWCWLARDPLKPAATLWCRCRWTRGILLPITYNHNVDIWIPCITTSKTEMDAHFIAFSIAVSYVLVIVPIFIARISFSYAVLLVCYVSVSYFPYFDNDRQTKLYIKCPQHAFDGPMRKWKYFTDHSVLHALWCAFRKISARFWHYH